MSTDFQSATRATRLGTSRVLTSGTGVVCYDADFYPYGGERSYTNTCPQNYKFEGKERDTETGNDDFSARYYSNRFGRWLSADWSSVPVPVPYANLTNPQTINLYAMVADDPESFADLDGHICFAGNNPICPPGGEQPPAKDQQQTQAAQAKAAAQLQLGVTPGQQYVVLTKTTETSTTDDKGVTTTTTTKPSALFSIGENNTAKYSGTVTTTTTVRSDDPKRPSSKTTFSQQDANGLNATFGGRAIVNAQSLAGGYARGQAWLNPKLSLRDVKNLVVGAALGACLVGEPCGAFAAAAGLAEGAYELHESIKHPGQ